MRIKNGTYIREVGISRLNERNLTDEMYCVGYYDEGIRRDLTVTNKEITELCSQMKEIAIANAKSEAQKGKRSIASTCSSTLVSAIIVSHDTESKKLSTQLF